MFSVVEDALSWFAGHRGGLWGVGVVCCWIAGFAQPFVLACERPALLTSRPSPAAPSNQGTSLVLETEQGSIEIELFDAAAPATLQRLKQLVEAPTLEPSLVPPSAEGAPTGFYDGLTFDFTRPHIEIVTATRETGANYIFSNELNAGALGLDRQLVSDTAQAMTILQGELLVAHREKKKSGQISDELKVFLDQWYSTYSPDFLLGVSTQRINEALGYVYQNGPESRPAVRGSVLLKPISPTHSSARLSVLLVDIPERTGRWMVIGQVTRGLEVAEAISVRPRVHDRREEFRPLNPVVIDRARLVHTPQDRPPTDPE